MRALYVAIGVSVVAIALSLYSIVRAVQIIRGHR